MSNSMPGGTPMRRRVTFVSTSYPRDMGDWRGLFIRHLAFALAAHPAVDLGIWAPPGERPTAARDLASASDRDWLGRLMAAGGIAHLVRTGGLRGWLEPLHLLRRLAALYRRRNDTDVYHINWLQSALPLPRDGKPALITVLGSDLKLLRLPLMKLFLRRVIGTRRAMICPNADWMEAPLTAAFGDLCPIRTIAFGIDPGWYQVARMPAGDGVHRWIAVTRLTHDKLGPLFDWAEPYFHGTGRELHLFGPMQDAIEIPHWVRWHGPATPEQLMRDWFPTATGLVSLSRHAEGRPQVMLEAMAAGLPIVASALPAHATLVETGVTGYLCHTPDGFGEAIAALEVETVNRRLGTASRRWASTNFGTWADCAQRYVDAYRTLMEPARDE